MQVPMSAREYTRFGAELYVSKGIAVEVWNCAPLLTPGYKTTETNEPIKHQALRAAGEVCAALHGLEAEDVVIHFLPPLSLTLKRKNKKSKTKKRNMTVRTNDLTMTAVS